MCTVADDQKLQFKSIYSPSKSVSVGIDNKRKSRISTDNNQFSSPYMTPLSPGQCLSEKTAQLNYDGGMWSVI